MQNKLSPDHWVSNYADYLYTFASCRVNNKEQAEDLVQETFLSAYKNREQYLGQANEKTWLTSILKNKIIDLYRSNARKAKVMIQEPGMDYFFETGSTNGWTRNASPKEMSPSALEKLQQKETNHIIDECIGLLPNQWHLISRMKWIDEEKTDTICKAFDITPSNFWVIMHRVKLQLRDCIQKKIIA